MISVSVALCLYDCWVVVDLLVLFLLDGWVSFFFVYVAFQVSELGPLPPRPVWLLGGKV